MFPILGWEEANKKIAEYYKYSAILYRTLWSQNTLAFHMGFWDKGIHSLAEALWFENKFLAEKARITKSDLILDAGCGIGGSAIWIVQTIGAQVIGIANESGLISTAKQNAIKNRVEDRVSFELQDYNHTNFSDNTFDVVWAIESFDYSPDKIALFKEVKRILKPGGRVIVADFFQNREIKNAEEQIIFDNITLTLAVYQTQWWGEYITILKDLGFKNIQEFDKTEAVMPSSRRIKQRGVIVTPIVYLLYPFKFASGHISTLYDNWKCAKAMDKTFRIGLIKYGVYCAEK